jgi:hypothetical protein
MWGRGVDKGIGDAYTSPRCLIVTHPRSRECVAQQLTTEGKRYTHYLTKLEQWHSASTSMSPSLNVVILTTPKRESKRGREEARGTSCRPKASSAGRPHSQAETGVTAKQCNVASQNTTAQRSFFFSSSLTFYFLPMWCFLFQREGREGGEGEGDLRQQKRIYECTRFYQREPHALEQERDRETKRPAREEGRGERNKRDKKKNTEGKKETKKTSSIKNCRRHRSVGTAG